MSDLIYPKKGEPVRAWQHTGNPNDRPMWVRGFTFLIEGEIFIERRSGSQLVRPTEWIIRGLDQHDPEWITDEMRRRDYE